MAGEVDISKVSIWLILSGAMCMLGNWFQGSVAELNQSEWAE